MTIAAGITASEARLAEICRRYHIRELSLFGSTARGQHRPDSDIDLLVEYIPDSHIGLFEHFDAEEEFASLFDKPVHLVAKSGLKERMRREILPEARVIYAV
jgi:predicted nucleotidyltransferase